MLRAGGGENRRLALERRAAYIRLRAGGTDRIAAADELDLPMGTRDRYERWARAEHPELGGAPGRPDARFGM
jgi:hypothetical protein